MQQFEKIQDEVTKRKWIKKKNDNVLEQREYIIAMKYVYLKYHITLYIVR